MFLNPLIHKDTSTDDCGADLPTDMMDNVFALKDIISKTLRSSAIIDRIYICIPYGMNIYEQ